jgi:hypothetical protein
MGCFLGVKLLHPSPLTLDLHGLQYQQSYSNSSRLYWLYSHQPLVDPFVV